MRMKWHSAILVFVLAFNCVSSQHKNFGGFSWCTQKNEKETFHVCFLLLFCILTYVFHLAHILCTLKYNILMQLRQSLCWVTLMDDSYQECLQDTS